MKSGNIWICVLSINPLHKRTISFLREIKKKTGYPIISVMDSNDIIIENNDPDITYVQIDENVTFKHGYKGTYLYKLYGVTARDKALYYLNRISNQKFEHVWIIEEDVFIPNIYTIMNIDIKYPDYDLLCSEFTIFEKREKVWHWEHVFQQVDIKPPYVKSMICAMRMSKNLLKSCDNFVKTYGTLFLDEAMFTTLTLKDNLSYKNPYELENILYRHDWVFSDIKSDRLYHPIKDNEVQHKFRDELTRENYIYISKDYYIGII